MSWYRLRVVVPALLLATVLSSGCINGPVSPIRLVDAYCDDNGHFNFTVTSTEDEVSTVEYRWTLNDPKADMPVFQGEGEASVKRDEPVHVSVELENLDGGGEDYDSRFFVMYITVLKDGKRVVEYREQKSPYDWDYSTLPPRKTD